MKEYKSNLEIVKLLDNPLSTQKQIAELRRLIKPLPNENESRIVSYLENGKKLFLTPLAVYDWLGDENKFISGASICTDGTWFWREYLSYFVKTYHFQLQDNIINHMINNNWAIPEISYDHEKFLVAEYYKLREIEKNKSP